MAGILDSASSVAIIGIVSAMVLAFIVTYVVTPTIIRTMKERGITGIDRNKREKMQIPELGGLAIMLGFPIGILFSAGIMKYLDIIDISPILAATSVIALCGLIGLLDDVAGIPRIRKPILIALTALPVMALNYGGALIEIPFGLSIDLRSLSFIYWLILVPVGITGAANAMNMSAGYNGLETGQTAVVSFFLLIAVILVNRNIESVLIFSALLGASLGLNYFNGYPAATFVGNVGTFAMGATIAVGVITAGIEVAGVIAIAPAFYELIAAFYFTFIKKVTSDQVRKAHSNPIIDENNKLHPPEGAEKFKLTYYILSKRPMTELNLVRTVLFLYVISGIAAIIVCYYSF